MVAVAHTDKVPEPRDRLAAHRVHKLGTAIIKERCKINHILACIVFAQNPEGIDSAIFRHEPAPTTLFLTIWLVTTTTTTSTVDLDQISINIANQQ
jgi:hypothetical protein